MGTTIELPGDLGIAEAADLHAHLARELVGNEDGTTITLDASAVRRVDTAGLQLVLAFGQECDARSIALEWKDVPAVMTEAARRIGLAQSLRLDPIDASSELDSKPEG